MYATHMYYHPDSTAEYRPKQAEQTSYHEKIIRNIDIVLQTDQVVCICKGLPQVPSPRYILTQDELENDNIRFICSHPMETQMSQIRKCTRLRNIDDLMDMGSTLLDSAP